MLNDPRRWLDIAPRYSRAQTSLARITILRDDLLEGGSKLRIVPFAVGSAAEVVYGGPFCGGAPHALSVWGRETGRRVTLFFAERTTLHPRQIAAYNGARIEQVSPGYLTVVQKRARDYAAHAGALFLPLGLDVPEAREALYEMAVNARARLGSPDQVWCATGSGMLAQVLGAAFPDSEICGTVVGLSSKNSVRQLPGNVRLSNANVPFARDMRAAGAPFPICGHYEAKAWNRLIREARGNVLFWNVAAPYPR